LCGVAMCSSVPAMWLRPGLFYERAADAGDALAALRLGESFDPDFLGHVHIRGVQCDRDMAIIWYRRARELGSIEAEILLKRGRQLAPNPQPEFQKGIE
jgi:TPR repeat protein